VVTGSPVVVAVACAACVFGFILTGLGVGDVFTFGLTTVGEGVGLAVGSAVFFGQPVSNIKEARAKRRASQNLNLVDILFNGVRAVRSSDCREGDRTARTWQTCLAGALSTTNSISLTYKAALVE
jgi:hypothetical protein